MTGSIHPLKQRGRLRSLFPNRIMTGRILPDRTEKATLFLRRARNGRETVLWAGGVGWVRSRNSHPDRLESRDVWGWERRGEQTTKVAKSAKSRNRRIGDFRRGKLCLARFGDGFWSAAASEARRRFGSGTGQPEQPSYEPATRAGVVTRIPTSRRVGTDSEWDRDSQSGAAAVGLVTAVQREQPERERNSRNYESRQKRERDRFWSAAA